MQYLAPRSSSLSRRRATANCLIALAAARPGSLTYGSTGVGSTSHLAGEIFNAMAKIKTVMVSYKGSTESAVATASGQIDSSFSTVTAVLPLLSSGRLRPLALTSLKRSPLLPETPTISESGLQGYECVTWSGLAAPAGTPKEVVERLQAEIKKALHGAAIKEKLLANGFVPEGNSSAEFTAFVTAEVDKWTKVAKEAGAQID